MKKLLTSLTLASLLMFLTLSQAFAGGIFGKVIDKIEETVEQMEDRIEGVSGLNNSQQSTFSIVHVNNRYNSNGVMTTGSQTTNNITFLKGDFTFQDESTGGDEEKTGEGYGIQVIKTTTTIYFSLIGGSTKPVMVETVTETGEWSFEDGTDLSSINILELRDEDRSSYSTTTTRDYYVYDSSGNLEKVFGEGEKFAYTKEDGLVYEASKATGGGLERIFEVMDNGEALLVESNAKGINYNYEKDGKDKRVYSKTINEYQLMNGKYVLAQSSNLSFSADTTSYAKDFGSSYEQMAASLSVLMDFYLKYNFIPSNSIFANELVKAVKDGEIGVSELPDTIAGLMALTYLENGNFGFDSLPKIGREALLKSGIAFDGDVSINKDTTIYHYDENGNMYGIEQDLDGLNFSRQNYEADQDKAWSHIVKKDHPGGEKKFYYINKVSWNPTAGYYVSFSDYDITTENWGKDGKSSFPVLNSLVEYLGRTAANP
jgi:hypothetical protein